MGKHLDKILTVFEEAVVALGLFYAVFIISLSVLLRALGYGIQWSDESVRYVMILGAFVGCSLCVKRKAHIAIDILQIVVKKNTYAYIEVLVNVISCVFCVIMFVLGLMMVRNGLAKPQLSPALQIHMWLCYLMLPVGFGLTSIRYAAEIVQSVLKIKESRS